MREGKSLRIRNCGSDVMTGQLGRTKMSTIEQTFGSLFARPMPVARAAEGRVAERVAIHNALEANTCEPERMRHIARSTSGVGATDAVREDFFQHQRGSAIRFVWHEHATSLDGGRPVIRSRRAAGQHLKLQIRITIRPARDRGLPSIEVFYGTRKQSARTVGSGASPLDR